MSYFFLSGTATYNMHEPILHKQGSCSLQLNYRKASDSRRPVCCASKWVFPLAGVALIDVGEALRELAEVKDALDMEVKQNFIDPLQNLHEKDLKEIQVRQSEPRPVRKPPIVSWLKVDVYCSCLAASPKENGGSPSGL